MTAKIFSQQGSKSMQQTLFDTPKITNGFRDPAFSRNRVVPLHRWVPWVAGFSAQFVQDCLDKYLPENRQNHVWVLDPFAGVGTALVEAYIRGLNVVGFEINPYAALAARLKLEAGMVSTKAFADWISAFEKFMDRQCGAKGTLRGEPKFRPPTGFSGRTRLFSPKVERKILFALDFVVSIESRRIRDLFRLALGSVMVSVSNYSYEPSLTRRSAVGKPEIHDADVASVFAAKLKVMLDDIGWLQNVLRGLPSAPYGQVIPASIFAAPQHLRRSGFVDLVVTSPPYLNNYHYPRNTRPQLHWLGFTSGTGYNGAYENESFGKFWQTVRALPPIQPSFKLPPLESAIEAIRKRNVDEDLYGGPGWANYVSTYFNDTFRFCQSLGRLLRPGGIAVIVLGNSVIQGIEVKTEQLFGQIAELCGLTFQETTLLRQKRTGSSIIESSVRASKPATKVDLYESAIVLKN